MLARNGVLNLLLLLLLGACVMRPVAAASLEALRAAVTGDLGHSLDAWCVAYRCPGQSYACVADAECRRCLACLHGCGSSETCSAGCLYRCAAEKLLTDFLVCAVVDHGCVQLQPSGGDGGGDECSAGSLPAWGPPASLQEARGRWFAVRGGHPFHDCHACRSELLDPDAGVVVGSFLFEGAAIGHTRQVLSAWPENGTLVLGHTKVGQAVTEVWRLSWPQDGSGAGAAAAGGRDSLMLSYCGSAGVWRYRGRLLLSRAWPRTPAAPPSNQQQRRLRGSPGAPGFACDVSHDNPACRRLLPERERRDSEEL